MLPGSYMMVVQYRRSLHIRRPKAGGACGRSWRATLPPSPLAPDEYPDYADLSAILLNATHAMWLKVSDITVQSDAVSTYRRALTLLLATSSLLQLTLEVELLIELHYGCVQQTRVL